MNFRWGKFGANWCASVIVGAVKHKTLFWADGRRTFILTHVIKTSSFGIVGAMA